MAVVSGQQPEVTRSRWSSTDPDAAAEYLRQTWVNLHPSSIPATGFAFWSDHSSIGPLAVGRLRHSGPVTGWADPAQAVVVLQIVAGGPVHIDHGEGRGHDLVKLVPTWTPFGVSWQDVTLQAVPLDLAEVTRIGGELAELEPQTVVLSSARPISTPLALYWCQLSAHVHEAVLDPDTVMGEPLVLGNTVRNLAGAALATFPNTALEVLTDPGTPTAGRAEPATVRRAIAFIDSHAHQDIGLPDISAAAQTGARSLQIAFRRYRDTTPLEYLRRVRLDGAHAELVAADPTRGDRVAAIAAKWGFAHPGRFSATYRDRYGRSPGSTLHL
ncbi:helix-turn-helix transcriptional regulator [Actinomycetospora sp. C-140]